MPGNSFTLGLISTGVTTWHRIAIQPTHAQPMVLYLKIVADQNLDAPIFLVKIILIILPFTFVYSL